LASSGCLLYTDSINMRPKVTIVAPSALPRGVPLSFTAVVTDDQSSAQYDFSAVQGACGAGGAQVGNQLVPGGSEATFTVSFAAPGEYCISVVVTDPRGATGTGSRPLVIGDQAPVPAIDPHPSAPIALYSDLRFSGARSSDPDPGDVLTLTWSVTLPGGAVMTPPACPDAPGGQEVCFPADVAGPYTLTLTVDDGSGGHESAVVSFTVATDRPPCIVGTLPPYTLQTLPSRDPAKALTFTVTDVDDDGDPVPAPDGGPPTAKFDWWWRVGSAPFERVTNLDQTTFGFAANTFHPGQIVQVRVLVNDRVARPDSDLAGCDQGLAICRAPQDCARWVTWTAEY
jgi:hypothetical protein